MPEFLLRRLYIKARVMSVENDKNVNINSEKLIDSSIVDDSVEDAEKKDSNRYIVHIENFEGPLDLLWSLIKKSKIDIVDVSLSDITEQYLNYLKQMKEMSITIASEFINMASQLIFYKSKMLLPTSEIEDEYFIPPLPPELVQKLIEYKKFQKASFSLKDMADLQSDAFTRESDISKFIENEEYVTMSLFDLLNAFVDVLGSQEKVEEREIKFDEILVSDRIDYLVESLRKKESLNFKELFPNIPSISMVVATFLAVLELTKVQKIRVLQKKNFGTIELYRNFDPEKYYRSDEFELTSAG